MQPEQHLNASIQSAMDNSEMLLKCLDVIIKDHANGFEVGEIIGIVKLTVCQIVILESPAFGSKD